MHSGVELNQTTFLDPGTVGKRDASRWKTCVKVALWPFRQIFVTLQERAEGHVTLENCCNKQEGLN